MVGLVIETEVPVEDFIEEIEPEIEIEGFPVISKVEPEPIIFP